MREVIIYKPDGQVAVFNEKDDKCKINTVTGCTGTEVTIIRKDRVVSFSGMPFEMRTTGKDSAYELNAFRPGKKKKK